MGSRGRGRSLVRAGTQICQHALPRVRVDAIFLRETRPHVHHFCPKVRGFNPGEHFRPWHLLQIHHLGTAMTCSQWCTCVVMAGGQGKQAISTMNLSDSLHDVLGASSVASFLAIDTGLPPFTFNLVRHSGFFFFLETWAMRAMCCAM